MYRIELSNENKIVRRLSDDACIPIDPPKEQVDPVSGQVVLVGGNVDYAEYLAWVAAGNVAEEVDLTPVPTLTEKRKAEYEKNGATIEALTVALWEKIVEGRTETANSIQAIREQVKTDLPKE